ncbi:MAG: hypothetical protein RLZZ628_1553 [Bacteroidota bacterium]|jgi:hypothetical protein
MRHNQFTFEAKQKNVFIGMMVIGLISLIFSYLDNTVPNHTRFWTNFLHNAAFFTGIGFAATFLIAAKITAYSGWHTVFKRLWEAYSLFLLVGLCLMGVVLVGVWGNLHHLYHWADAKTVASDEILKGKSSFLNKYWYTLATFGFVGVWYFFAQKFRKLSIEQDSASYDTAYPIYIKAKKWGAGFLPIAGFTSVAVIWQWLMSLDAHWYSTMYGWYTIASWVVSMIAITILMLIYLKSLGYYPQVSKEHLHDLGKYLFAFSIFWTYLWFSQYMLIWYANVGEETVYFRIRMGEFPILFYGNLVLNFVLPFLILIRNDTKRKTGSLGFIAAIVLFGHWIDFFQMAKIGPYKSALEHHAAAGHGASHGAATADPHAAKPADAHAAKPADAHAAPAPAAHADAHEGLTEAARAAEGHDAHATVAKKDVLEPENYFHYDPDMTPGFAFPGFLELGVMLGFAGLFLFFVFGQLTKASLVPTNDPYLEETLHHHV